VIDFIHILKGICDRVCLPVPKEISYIEEEKRRGEGRGERKRRGEERRREKSLTYLRISPQIFCNQGCWR
jgi:hypothetical protein